MNCRGAVIAAGALLSLVGTARAATVDLVDQVGLRLERPVRILNGDEMVPARAGDVDGDGLSDLLLAQSNVVYVVPGRPSLRSAPRLGFRHPGYRILGPEGVATAAPAGDFNGDGLADVIVTAPYASAFYRRLGPRRREVVDGAAYVILGSARHEDVHLARLGSRGFRIAGTETGAASGIGDVNGDGLDDVAVGASYPGRDGVSVVYGSARPRSLRADRVEERGYEIRGRAGDISIGSALTRVGDFDGDGYADFAIGDVISLGRPPDPQAYEEIGLGAAYVVFGSPEAETLRLADPNGRALRVNPADRAFLTGYSVAGPGDVNGDGLSDLAVGAPADPFGRRPGPGSAWVVFGSSSRARIELSRLGTRGFRIAGARRKSGLGTALDAAGDVDGDGLADLLVGAPGDFEETGLAAGAAYVVTGAPSTGTVDVRELERTGDRGFALRGLPGDQAGLFVAAPGDLDGDGRPELAIAAPRSCAGAAPRFAGEETERSSAAVVYLATVGLLVATRSTDERDRLDAARGGERLRGRGGADLLGGSAAADCLYGDRGRDRVLGRGGGDVLLGGTGRDRLSGGDGTDLLHAADGSRDVVRCGAGRDRAVVDRHDRASRCERLRVR